MVPPGRSTPVQRIDPGPDGILGTTDDGAPLTLYQLSSTGATSYLVTNPDAAFRDYDAWQVIELLGLERSHSVAQIGEVTMRRWIAHALGGRRPAAPAVCAYREALSGASFQRMPES